MFVIKTYVAPSSTHGLGCFAGEKIKKGQLVWTEHPELDIHIPAKNLKKYPAVVQSFLRRYAYIQKIKGKNTWVLGGDNSRYMNHSSDPNVIEVDDGSENDVAARSIAKGEELTCDYGTFDLEAKKKKLQYLK